jgi:tartrate dehydrogenase/decarboxylase/D-malate dehydrogenase
MGKGIANPIAMIWAGSLMLGFLGEAEAAKLIMEGISNTVLKGQVITPDLGGTATTSQVGQAICDRI